MKLSLCCVFLAVYFATATPVIDDDISTGQIDNSVRIFTKSIFVFQKWNMPFRNFWNLLSFIKTVKLVRMKLQTSLEFQCTTENLR